MKIVVIAIFAGIGIVYSAIKIAQAVLWVVKYKNTIEAYAELLKIQKED